MSDVMQLDLPATHAAVRVARHLVRLFARLRGISERELDTLVLVATELLSNAVDHGGGGRAMDESELANGVRMGLHLDVGMARWQLEVSDQGGGDPERFRAMLLASGLPDADDDRGRGLFLMRTTVDRLDVTRSEDGRGLRIIAVREHAGH